jgi:uncharacterized protein (TIGR03084 family)
MDEICDDLAAEHEALDALLRDRPDEVWDRPTPAPGWAVRDQISHLWFFDGTARLALIDEDAYRASGEELLASVAAGEDPSIVPGRAMAPADLLAAWREGRAALLEALRATDPKTRVPWYGPAMSARSFATARLMETWAHGQDVADALGVERPPSARLRHVAHIGVRARPFAYATRGLAMPDEEVLVELVAPDGGSWSWGPPDAASSVRGDALDFCLIVTQRRHWHDTALEVQGDAAIEWIGIAQAFAGPPGPGRQPGQFASGAAGGPVRDR